MKLSLPTLSAALLLTAALTGCADQLSDVQPQPVAATQQSDLKKTNSAIQAVLIDLAKVEVHGAQGARTTLTDVAAGPYNLLTAGSNTTLLFTTRRLPAGSIQGLRLVLGNNSKIQLADGTLLKLDTPSGTTSGLKVQLEEVVATANTTYQVRVKFTVERDIVRRGNGTFGLKPVLRGSLVKPSITTPPTPTPPPNPNTPST